MLLLVPDLAIVELIVDPPPMVVFGNAVLPSVLYMLQVEDIVG